MAYRVGIDIGGTFTDFALQGGRRGGIAIHKQLTTPDDPSRAVLEGFDTLLGQGVVVGMLVTAGFADVMDMGREKRYDVFDRELHGRRQLYVPSQ